jgi:hypothetical protein
MEKTSCNIIFASKVERIKYIQWSYSYILIAYEYSDVDKEDNI